MALPIINLISIRSGIVISVDGMTIGQVAYWRDTLDFQTYTIKLVKNNKQVTFCVTDRILYSQLRSEGRLLTLFETLVN